MAGPVYRRGRGPFGLASQVMKSVFGGVPPRRRSSLAHCARWPCVCRQTCMSAWTTDGDVKASLVRDGVVYIAGNFTHLVPPSGSSSSAIAVQHVAALSATTGQPIPGFSVTVDDGAVDAITLSADRSRIYLGGAFTHSGGAFAGHVMAIDPSRRLGLALIPASYNKNTLCCGRAAAQGGGNRGTIDRVTAARR